MTLSSYRIEFLIPYFVEMQRKSFLNLLDTGLIYELSKRNPISDSQKNFHLIFYPEYYKLTPPEYTAKEAILKAKTYASKLYVPIQLANYKTKQIKLQWIVIGNLPLMTKRGHFIVNGSPRTIVNQLVRSPGIYYQQAIDQKKRKTYYADLISHRGAWLRFETDVKKQIWVRMKKTPKISILVFFQALGINQNKIEQSIKYSEFLEFSNTDDLCSTSTEDGLLALYSLAHPKKKEAEITADLAKRFLYRKFFNSRTYDLSRLGRLQLNKKFNLSVSPNKNVLTVQDFLVIIDYLIKLEYGVGLLDDIDNLKNRRVRASGELIQNQLGTGFIRLEKLIREKIKSPGLSISNIITTKPINGALREFFGSSPLSQFMDQTNPLAELTHKRRISSLGPGGISRETAGMAVRGIHPTHYGRICPIETPEGPNAGLVNSITILARMNSYGFLETPFYSVYQGQIQKQKGAVFLSAAQEEFSTIAPGDLKTNYFNFLPSTNIPVRSHGEFKKLYKNQVEYMSVSPIQMISIATSLIPFLEHDDANRALMGSNMQRQAVPLIAPEKPIVGTGLEARVTSDSGHGIQAKTNGFVSYVSNNTIIIQNFNKKKLNFFSRCFRCFSTQKTTQSQIKKKNILYSNYQLQEKYLLDKFFSSNQSISINQSFSLLTQILMSSTSEQNKFLTLGTEKQAFYIKRSVLKNKFKKSGVSVTPLTILVKAQHKESYNPSYYFQTNFKTIFTKANFNDKKFLNLSKLYLNDYFKNSANSSTQEHQAFDSNKFNKSTQFDFKKKFLIACTKLVCTQTFVQQKNLKHMFFYECSAWKNRNNNNFIRINKKNSSVLYIQSPYASTLLKKYGNTKLANKNNMRSLSLLEKTIPERNSIKSLHWSTKKISPFIKSSSGPLQRKDEYKLKSNHKLSLPLSNKLTSVTLNNNRDTSLTDKKISSKLLSFTSVGSVALQRKGQRKGFSRTSPQVGQGKEKLHINQYNSKNPTKINLVVKRKPKKNFTELKISQKKPIFSTWGEVLPNPKKSLNFLSQFQPWELYGAQCVAEQAKQQGYENFSKKKLSYSLQAYQRSNQDTCIYQRPLVQEGEWVEKGDLIADGAASVGGELSLGKTILVAYMPWEGYNFEDAILISQRLIYDDLYTSIHIERYEIEICDTKFGLEEITSKIPDITYSQSSHLDNQGIAKLGSWVNQGDILVGKVTPIKKKQLSKHEKLLSAILSDKRAPSIKRDSSLRLPKNISGRVVHVELLETENIPPEIPLKGPSRVHIYIAEKRKIQVGDKMSGRHGNKGIVSKILPRQDMPYLPDGTPIDMVLNPLGVPSRMNVGQIFECLLGLAGKELHEQFKISCFDEMHGPEASRSLTYSKLFQARIKTGKQWLFNPNSPGKVKLFDGRTGECFHQTVTVGHPYMLKLVHQVDEKIHARSTGPYALVTQQPLRGRSKHGGQRLGEMEVWALEGFGAAYILQELLTSKSDDIKGRHQVMQAILENKPITVGTPESFKVLVRELQSLCLDIGVYSLHSSGNRKRIDIMQLS